MVAICSWELNIELSARNVETSSATTRYLLVDSLIIG